MILTLSARCLRSMLVPQGRGKRAAMDLLDLPRYTRESLGLSGVNLSTDLLAGADRLRLESFRERADKVGCACLLLIEPEPQDFAGSPARTEQATTRARKVVEAAQILGCSATAIRVAAPDNDDALVRAASALKPVVERAEKLDINLLLAPHEGLTKRPDRVTELLKKVGGFRIGTFPDLQDAAASSDPVGYLHRLTPYATAVCATTIELVEEDAPPPKPARAKEAGKTAAATKDSAATKEDDEDTELAGAPDVEGEDDDDLNDAELDELERMIDEAIDDDDEEPVLRALRHKPYDLVPLIKAITDVGFDGPLTLDYRGAGDASEGILKSRDTLLALLALAKRAGA